MSDVEGWRDDPARFAADVLRMPDEHGNLQPLTPWSRQAELLRRVAANDYVACKAGQKTSKTNSLAILAIWWCVTRPHSRVLLTAPTGHQIKDIIWPEIRQLHTNARYPLGGRLFVVPSKGLVWGDKWGIFAVTADKPESLQGLSGARQMVIVDEASGYPEPLFGALQGNLAGGGKLILTSNPTQTSGTFFDAFNKNREHWSHMTISALESPNFDPTRPRVPGLATPEKLAQNTLEWGGVGSPLYQVRALGEFPTQGSNAVVGLALVDAAVKRWDTTPDTGPLTLGVDVARFGDDDSCIAPRRGQRINPLRTAHGKSTDQVVGWVLEVATELRRGDEIVTANVDSIGVGGGVADGLRALGLKWLIVNDVNASERARDHEQFNNRRSEMAFAVTDFLEEGGALPPNDAKLEGELVAPVYDFDPQGRRRVESKDAIKKRIKRSPDRGDAVALAVTRSTHAQPAELPPLELGPTFGERPLHEPF